MYPPPPVFRALYCITALLHATSSRRVDALWQGFNSRLLYRARSVGVQWPEGRLRGCYCRSPNARSSPASGSFPITRRLAPPHATGYRVAVPIEPDRCPPDAEQVAEAYANGRLAASDVAVFRQHIARCCTCTALVEREEKVMRVLRNAGRIVGHARRQST